MAVLGQVICLFLGLLTLTWVMTLAIALSQRECYFSLYSNGNLPTSAPSRVWREVASFMRCTQLCMTSLGAECLSVGYSKEQRECRGYSVFNKQDVIVASPGHKYYVGCPVCPNGYSDTYNKSTDWILSAHDMYGAPGTTEAACMAVCTSDPHCASIDWDGSMCYIHYVTKDAFPLWFYEGGAPWVYFERLCNP